jgi:hypothetical protein
MLSKNVTSSSKKSEAGRLGGEARARKLAPAQRRAVASKAALARWRPAGAPFHPSPASAKNLERSLAKAVALTGRDASVARMLPVLLWRCRAIVDQTKLVAASVELGVGARMGYFLDLASRVSGERVCGAALAELRARHPGKARLEHLHDQVAASPWRSMLAEAATPPFARRWGLLTGTSVESAKEYFDKVALL